MSGMELAIEKEILDRIQQLENTTSKLDKRVGNVEEKVVLMEEKQEEMSEMTQNLRSEFTEVTKTYKTKFAQLYTYSLWIGEFWIVLLTFFIFLSSPHVEIILVGIFIGIVYILAMMLLKYIIK